MEVTLTKQKKSVEKKKGEKHSSRNLCHSYLHAQRAEQQGKGPTRDLLAPLRDQRHLHAAQGALGLRLGGVVLFFEGGDDVANPVAAASRRSASIADGVSVVEALLRSRPLAASDVFIVLSAREDAA